MDIYYIVSSWVCIAYIYLGFYIYRADPKKNLNRMLLFFNCALAAASVCNLGMYAWPEEPVYGYWYIGAALSWGIYANLVLKLSMVLTKRDGFRGRYRKYLVFYLPLLIVMVLEIFFMRGFHADNPALYIISNIFEYLYYFGYPLAALAVMYTWGRKARRLREKKQAILIVAASLTALTLSATATLGVYAFKAPLPDLTHIINFIPTLAIWHVIRKYRLISLEAFISTVNVISRVTDLIFITDDEDKILWTNSRCEELLGFRRNELDGEHISRVIEDWGESGAPRDSDGESNAYLSCRTRSGGIIPVSIRADRVPDAVGETAGNVVICKDMTLVMELQAEIAERREKEGELKYMSLHDTLTGLFNRRCFEQEMLSVEREAGRACGIVICDVDGLKFVNDTMGHKTGDQLLIKAGEIIREAFEAVGTVYRIGGDEFAALLPNADTSFIKDAEKRIKEAVRLHNALTNDFYMSISIGFAVKEALEGEILKTFKEADNNMYKEKLNHIKSTRSSMVQGLLKLLEVRDFITEGHADRMKELAADLGEFIGLPENKLMDLRLLAQFHDIGKVGIPDRILFKAGKLSEEEMEEMRGHSELGYRISKSIPELSSVAEFILKHHERWDGKGYPLGIKGLDIPLECRILSIVDAFDAMTHDRPYRRAMSEAAAMEELRANAGTQFDSDLVGEFFDLLSVLEENRA